MPEMACIRDDREGRGKEEATNLAYFSGGAVGRSFAVFAHLPRPPHPIAPATYQNIDSALPS